MLMIKSQSHSIQEVPASLAESLKCFKLRKYYQAPATQPPWRVWLFLESRGNPRRGLDLHSKAFILRTGWITCSLLRRIDFELLGIQATSCHARG